MPSNIELKDGEEFISSADNINGSYAFKEIYIPCDSYKDAVEYCKKNKIKRSRIGSHIEKINGEYYVIKLETYQCVLKGHFYNYEVNQYEGEVKHNTLDYFPIKMENVLAPVYGPTLDVLLDAAKDANKNRYWPSNAGISKLTWQDESLFEIIKVK